MRNDLHQLGGGAPSKGDLSLRCHCIAKTVPALCLQCDDFAHAKSKFPSKIHSALGADLTRLDHGRIG